MCYVSFRLCSDIGDKRERTEEEEEEERARKRRALVTDPDPNPFYGEPQSDMPAASTIRWGVSDPFNPSGGNVVIPGDPRLYISSSSNGTPGGWIWGFLPETVPSPPVRDDGRLPNQPVDVCREGKCDLEKVSRPHHSSDKKVHVRTIIASSPLNKAELYGPSHFIHINKKKLTSELLACWAVNSIIHLRDNTDWVIVCPTVKHNYHYYVLAESLSFKSRILALIGWKLLDQWRPPIHGTATEMVSLPTRQLWYDIALANTPVDIPAQVYQPLSVPRSVGDTIEAPRTTETSASRPAKRQRKKEV